MRAVTSLFATAALVLATSLPILDADAKSRSSSSSRGSSSFSSSKPTKSYSAPAKTSKPSAAPKTSTPPKPTTTTKPTTASKPTSAEKAPDTAKPGMFGLSKPATGAAVGAGVAAGAVAGSAAAATPSTSTGDTTSTGAAKPQGTAPAAPATAFGLSKPAAPAPAASVSKPAEKAAAPAVASPASPASAMGLSKPTQATAAQPVKAPALSKAEQQGERKLSKQAYQQYKAEQNKFKAAPAKPVTGAAAQTRYSQSQTFTRARSYKADDYYRNRTEGFRRNNYQPPVVVYNTSPSYGMFDTLALFMILDSIDDANDRSEQAAMWAYSNGANPDYQAWRADAEKLAAQDATIKAQLAQMDAKVSALAAQNAPVNPDALPEGVTPEMVVAPSAVIEPANDNGGMGLGGWLALLLILGAVGGAAVWWISRPKTRVVEL